MDITNERVKSLQDGGVIIAMAQNQDGKEIGLKVVVDHPYDWDSIKYNAIKMIEALKKYKEEHDEFKKGKIDHDD